MRARALTDWLVHTDMTASQSCCTSMMPISYAAAFSPAHNAGEYPTWLLGLQVQISNKIRFTFHVWKRPDSHLTLSRFMHFFSAYTFMLQLWSVPQKVGSLEPGSVLSKTHDCIFTLAQNIKFIFINHRNKSPIKSTWKYIVYIYIYWNIYIIWKYRPQCRYWYWLQYRYWYWPQKSSISGADVWKKKLTGEP